MRAFFTTLLIVCVSIINSSAKTWLVGAARAYTLPSQVSGLVNDGDTVAIDSGTYHQDVAFWAANNLVLEGVGGMARLKSGGLNYGGKAIWVINGNNTVVNYIEFSECTCTDNNGAGIRQQGINLTIYKCLFDSNQEGILADDDTTSDILIEYTEFKYNGAGDGYSHNLYINHVHSLTFQYNYSHLANVGHELKSRAYNNYIWYNRFADEATGTASRDLDIPNGGFTIILGNEIEKGPNAQNENVMEYGLEGLTDPSTQLYLVNNTIVSDRSNTLFVDMEAGTSLWKGYNNIFAGVGTILSGSATTTDTSNNWYVSVANAGFVNAANYDYHLLSTSGAINNGTDPGYANTYSLTPLYEYVQPTNDTLRIINGALDIGAHEYGITTTAVYPPTSNNPSILVYPNPSDGEVNISWPASQGIRTVELFDYSGRLISEKQIESVADKAMFTEWHLTAGVYFLRVIANNKILEQPLVIQH